MEMVCCHNYVWEVKQIIAFENAFLDTLAYVYNQMQINPNPIMLTES